MDELVDAVNNLTINDTKYYESNTATASDSQGDLARDLETVTHTSNKNETANHTSNGNFEQKILSNLTIPVVVLTVKLKIEQMIALEMLFTPVTEEVEADTSSGGAWVNMTPQQLVQAGFDGSTPENIRHAVSVIEPSCPVLIGIVVTFPPFVLNASYQVANKWRSSPPDLVRHTQNWTLSLTESCPMI